jgi:hypothetical protein
MTDTANTQALHVPQAIANTIWIVLAFLACASVLLVNGRPLFYFDTVGYVDQGNVALTELGVIKSPEGGVDVVGKRYSQPGEVHTVDGSRSPSYSLLAGVFSQIGFLEGLLAMSAGALFVTVWLLARVTMRLHAPEVSQVALAAIPLIAAGFGSLPFYLAYLMPDLLAPVMILCLAMITAFGRKMRIWELLLAYALAAFAIVSHLSHFAIAGLMLLAVVSISALMGRKGWWLAPLVVVAVLATAYAQQKAFRVVAQNTAKSEVVIKPYITARLIQDGPGMRYLESRCPNPKIATCALYEALMWSDDPYRLTASHIVFENSKRLGSFQLMTEVDQKHVADAQVGFFIDVLKAMPVATTLALLHNTLLQSSMVSVDMTLPSDKIVARNTKVHGMLSGPMQHGRLTADTGWLPPLMQFQRTYYVAALAMVASLLVLPRSVPGTVKVFAVMILLGILANAFVCGGISQPATRYGARVIWLLPFLSAFMLCWAAGPTWRNGEQR